MNIKNWDPKFKKGEHFSMTIISPRRTGKSYLIKHLFEKYDFNRRFDIHVVFSQSLSNQLDVDFYANFVPGSWQYCDPKKIPEVLARLSDLQDDILKDVGKYCDILIIFDDMVSVKQKYSDDILQVYTRGRNKGMSIIMTSQSPALINKDWRINSDYAIMFFDKDVMNRRKNIDNFIMSLWNCEDISMSRGKIYQEIDKEYLKIVKEPHQALVADFINNELCKYKAN